MRDNVDMTDSILAFQGVAGAYSHLACQARFPSMQTLSCHSFEDTFEAVRSGNAHLLMIPIENSLGGRVADIHQLLPGSGLFIIDEHFQPVHHCLLAPKGANIEELTRVLSHPQALAQCREQLRVLNIEPVAHTDTADAARLAAQNNDPHTGAIASKLAAETYGLEILRERVEDRLGNTTRFVVMSRNRTDPEVGTESMMSFVFQTRSQPAALYKALGGFATNGVNITKLESYITDASFSVAQFYAEIEGHPADKNVDRAMEELQYFSEKVRILGAYPRNDFRSSIDC